jgi:hypothetical protein
MPQEPQYASFLLRLWASEENGQLTWRASLESTRTGQRQNFACVQALIAFLQAQFDSTQESRTKDSGREKDRELLERHSLTSSV